MGASWQLWLETNIIVLDTVDLIYSAALEPSLWDDALRSVAQLCGAQAAGLRIERSATLTQRWIGLADEFNAVGVVVSRTPERLITLGVMGTARRRFSEPQKYLIERLVPHLKRAIHVGERLLCSPVEITQASLEERIQLTYGLTRAEARVAAHIGQGFVPKQIAMALGTSWNTVRFQLRQVFAKTRTSGQADLTRLLARIETTR